MKLTTPKSTVRGLKLLVKELLPYWFRIIVILIMLSVATVGTVIAPLVIKRAIDVEIPARNIAGVVWLSSLLMIGVFVAFIARYIQLRSTGVLGQSVLFDLRRRIFTKMQELPLKFYSEQQTGDIIQRITGNVDAINSLLSEGIMRLLGIVFGLGAQSIIMILVNPLLGGIVTAGGLLILAFLWIQGSMLEDSLKRAFELESHISSSVQQSLSGYKIVKAFSQEQFFIKDIDEKSKTYLKNTYSIAALGALSEGVMGFISMAIGVGVISTALILYGKGIISPGTVVLFVAYLIGYFRQMSGISDLWLTIQRGIAAAERITELLRLKEDLHGPENPYAPDLPVAGKVEFRHVTFSYGNDRNVLEDISFDVEPGTSIAIIGPTGAGKTTFVNLIARLYDVKNGSILVDDIDIKEWDTHVLRKNIGYLIQDTFLFEDTILNNLRYSNPHVSEESALEMFSFLGAKEFIEKLPDGINTKLQIGGENISAGQRQIIALVRVLLRNPRILILDEATSRIDTKSEKLIQKAIEKANEGRTSFIIAHRLSTIFAADRIILLQDNKIAESGTHEELLAKKGFYYEMYSKFVGKLITE